MLKKRIICTLLWDDFGAVKGRGFKPDRRIGPMMQAIRVFERRNIDELIILDIAATPQERGPRFEEIKEFTAELFCPVTVGGGVRTVGDVVGLLNAGADKVAICTQAYLTDGRLLDEAARKIGSQSVVGVIDAMGNPWNVMSHCGSRKCDRGTVGYWSQWLEDHGAGEILVTSIDRDGTLEGYDLDLIDYVACHVSVPVIASGGCKSYEDMEAAFDAGADAVAAGALFQFTEATPRGAARYLHDKGIPVRLQ